MTESIITHEQLKEAFGCKTKDSLESLMRQQKVAFLYGRDGRQFTTTTALNAAMGLIATDQQGGSDIEFRR